MENEEEKVVDGADLGEEVADTDVELDSAPEGEEEVADEATDSPAEGEEVA